jgi:ABC-2 type transport system permease protein
MTGSWVVWDLVREVKDGTLSTRLLRPIHPLVAYSAENLAASRSAR